MKQFFKKILIFAFFISSLFACIQNFEDISSNDSDSNINFLKGEVSFFEKAALDSSKSSKPQTFFSKTSKISDNDFVLQENSIIILYDYEDTEHAIPIAITKTDSNGQFNFNVCDFEKWANYLKEEEDNEKYALSDEDSQELVTPDKVSTDTQSIDCTTSEGRATIKEKIQTIVNVEIAALIRYTENYQSKYYMISVLNGVNLNKYVGVNPFQATISQIIKSKLESNNIDPKDFFKTLKSYQNKIITFDTVEDKNAFVTNFVKASETNLNSQSIAAINNFARNSDKDISNDIFERLKNDTDLIDDSLLDIDFIDNPQPSFKDHNAYIIIMEQSLKDALDNYDPKVLQDFIDMKKKDFKFIYVGTEHKTYLHYKNNSTPTVTDIGWNAKDIPESSDKETVVDMLESTLDWLDVIYEDNEFNYILFIGERNHYYHYPGTNAFKATTNWLNNGHKYNEYTLQYGLKIGHLPLQTPSRIKTIFSHWKNYQEATDIEYRKNMIVAPVINNSSNHYIAGESTRKMASFMGWTPTHYYDPDAADHSNYFGVWRMYFNSEKIGEYYFPWGTLHEDEKEYSNSGDLIGLLNAKKFGSLYFLAHGNYQGAAPLGIGYGKKLLLAKEFDDSYTNTANHFFFFSDSCATASNFEKSVTAAMMEKGAIGGFAARDMVVGIIPAEPYLDNTFAYPMTFLKKYMTCTTFGDLVEDPPFFLYGDPSLGFCSSNLPILKVTHNQDFLTLPKGYAFDGRKSSSKATIYLHNVGYTDLTINGLAFDNSNNGLFTITTQSTNEPDLKFPLVIPPYQSYGIIINFKANDDHATNRSNLIINSNAAFYKEYKIPFTVNKVFNIRTEKSFKTIQSAIDNANKDDILAITKGIYYENLNIDFGKHYDNNFKLYGMDAENTIIDGQFKKETIKVTYPNIQGVTIQNGYMGGIHLTYTDQPINQQTVRVSINLTDVIIQNNIGKLGGGMRRGTGWWEMGITPKTSRAIDYYLTNVKFKNNFALEGGAIWDDEINFKQVSMYGNNSILLEDPSLHIYYRTLYDGLAHGLPILDINILTSSYNIDDYYNDDYDKTRRTYPAMLFLVKDADNGYSNLFFIDYSGRKTESNLNSSQSNDLQTYVVKWQKAMKSILTYKNNTSINVPLDSYPDFHLYSLRTLNPFYRDVNDFNLHYDSTADPIFLKDSSYNDFVIFRKQYKDGASIYNIYQHKDGVLVKIEDKDNPDNLDKTKEFISYSSEGELEKLFNNWLKSISELYTYLHGEGLVSKLKKTWPSVYHMKNVTFEGNRALDTPNMLISNKSITVEKSKFDYLGTKLEDLRRGRDHGFNAKDKDSPIYNTYVVNPELSIRIEFVNNDIPNDAKRHFFQSTFYFKTDDDNNKCNLSSFSYGRNSWSDDKLSYLENFDDDGLPNSLNKRSLNYTFYEACQHITCLGCQDYDIAALFFNSDDHFFARAFSTHYVHKKFPSKTTTYDLNSVIFYNPMAKSVIDPSKDPIHLIDDGNIPFTGSSVPSNSRKPIMYDQTGDDQANTHKYSTMQNYEEYSQYNDTYTLKDFYYKHGYNNLFFKWRDNRPSVSGAGYQKPDVKTLQDIKDDNNVLFIKKIELVSLPESYNEYSYECQKYLAIKITFRKNFTLNECMDWNDRDCKILFHISLYDQKFNLLNDDDLNVFLPVNETDDQITNNFGKMCNAYISQYGTHIKMGPTDSLTLMAYRVDNPELYAFKFNYKDIYYVKISNTDSASIRKLTPFLNKDGEPFDYVSFGGLEESYFPVRVEIRPESASLYDFYSRE